MGSCHVSPFYVIIKNNSAFIYIYIYILYSETLKYFKALMGRGKERRAFIVTYIWVFFWYVWGFLFSYICDSI
jgi:hypothetical protein